MPLQTGDVVDRYRLEKLLGIGAFGEVWKASKLADGESIGVNCAIKVMRLAYDRAGSSPRTFAGGWLDEVRNLVRVTDETIPRIHEANVWNEHAYIAMELLDGTTLATRLAHGPVAWRRALFIAGQIARALETAHQIGIIHRDLKPQNVMLAGARRVCVVDWGIARLSTSPQVASLGIAHQPVSSPEATDATPVAPIVTPHPQRVAVGTPGYMAPEVYEGARPAPEQDAYALGVVLYEMIAGCLPHVMEADHCSRTNSDAMKAYRALLDKATMDYTLVPLRERCPETPMGVIELVDSLLAREPQRRPRRIRDAIEHANRFPHGIPDPPYTGLGTLGPRHAGLYFGQQDTIQHVLKRFKSQQGILLWGPSGSGKSSLALAGVAATMDQTLFLDMDGWDIHVIRPRDGHVLHVLRDAAPSSHATIGQVVVIDQLEEVVDLEIAERDMFCAGLLALLERSSPVRVRDAVITTTDEVRVIATIRDDLEWRVDREVPALRPLFEQRVIVKSVDANFARSIIEEPARTLDYQVEEIEAVSREVEAYLSSEPAKLPVVQYALSEWWERRDARCRLLPAAAWRELGGVDGALSFVAERLFSALDFEQRLRLKALFVQLFRNGRKQPLFEAALTDGDRPVMDQLIRLRLVGRREKEGSAPFYEVEHESLSQYWRRLAEWLAEARETQILVEDLERDAAAYLRDHDPERLWKRGRIAAAMEMASRSGIVLSGDAIQFLRLGRRRALRGRLLLLGLALVLSVVWLGAVNAVTSAQRNRIEDRSRELDAREQKIQKLVKQSNATVELARSTIRTQADRLLIAQAQRDSAQELERAERDAVNNAHNVMEEARVQLSAAVTLEQDAVQRAFTAERDAADRKRKLCSALRRASCSGALARQAQPDMQSLCEPYER